MNEQSKEEMKSAQRMPGPLKKLILRLVFGFASLVTLVAVIYVEENWRGKHAWERYKAELESRGEKLDFASYIPPAVPDDQNFAMTPFLRPLLDLNPKPLQPGQSIYRDTNGFNRANDFATDLMSTSAEYDTQRRWHDRNTPDYDIWLMALTTNGPGSVAPFAAKAEAAQELLKTFAAKYDPVLDELEKASQLPYCRFNIHYTDADPAEILLPHLAVMKKLTQLYRLRTSADLAAGKSDKALADEKMTLYLAGTMKNEPFVISGLVRIAILHIGLRPLEAGLTAHQWNDAQLAELEDQFAGIDLAAEYESVMRGERSTGNGVMDYLRGGGSIGDVFDGPQPPPARVVPAGWLYQNQLTINRGFQDYLLPPVDAASHRFYPDKCRELDTELTNYIDGGFRFYRIFARMMMPALENAVKKYAFAQVSVDEATVVCALERYRLANGQYPETLAALEPKFIKSVPKDAVSGEALKYRRTDDGKFLLYSVGWNGTDDGGNYGLTTGTSPHQDQFSGDWVWPPYQGK
jgi:hypothetical protein